MGIFKELSNSAVIAKLSFEADKAWEKKNYQKAIDAYSKLINLDYLTNEQRSLYIEFRGDVYSEIEDKESALNHYEAAVEMNPLSDSALTKLAIQLNLFGEVEEAYSAVNKALKINPNNELAKKVLSFLDDNI